LHRLQLNIPLPPVSVDRLRAATGGRFRRFDGYGQPNTNEINSRHANHAPAELLAELLLDLIRAWQQQNGTPGKRDYHNRQFKTKARCLGLTSYR
jgi:hypothetical protein